MPRHIELGKKGEDCAAEWLAQKGYDILHRNWRHGRYEVDIIALHEKILHFIEVKCRKWSVYGYPEESVSPKKLKNIMKAALAWQIQRPCPGRIQYDVLSITIRPGAEPEYFFIEDVYL
jgi:putative endonuclease